MSNYYSYKPGIGEAGQYYMSGRPWFQIVTTPASSGHVEPIEFPRVTKSFTILSTNEDILLYFNAAAPAANKITIEAASEPRIFNVKCRRIYIETATGNATTIQTLGELTGITDEYILTGSGITGP